MLNNREKRKQSILIPPSVLSQNMQKLMANSRSKLVPTNCKRGSFESVMADKLANVVKSPNDPREYR